MNQQKKFWLSQASILLAGLICFLIISRNYNTLKYSDLASLIPSFLIISFVIELIFKNVPKKFLESRMLLFLNDEHRTIQSIILLCLSIIFGITILFEKWQSLTPNINSYRNGVFTIAGYLPHSDTLGYLMTMQTFTKFGEIVNTAIYRPLGSLFYAVIFQLCSFDFTRTIIALTLLVSISNYFASKVIARSFGFTAGFLMLILLWQYSLTFINSLNTEIGGLIFGNIGFALLWKGVSNRKPAYFYVGFFLIGTALNIRAGVMFLLPFLIFIPLFLFKKQGKKISLKHGAIVISVFLLTLFSTNFVLKFLETKPKAISNIGYQLHQFYVGSPKWNIIEEDHPEFFKGNSMEKSTQLVNDFAINEVKNDPMPFFRNIFKSYKQALQSPLEIIFHFNPLINKNAIYFFFFISFLILVLAKREEERWLILVLFIALLASFLSSPILEQFRNRLYAATVVFNCAFACLGIAMLQRIFQLLIDKFLKSDSRSQSSTTNQKKKKAKSNQSFSLKEFFSIKKDPNKVDDMNKSTTFNLDILSFVYPSVLLFSILIGPIILDKLRPDPEKIIAETSSCESTLFKKMFVFDKASSPWIKIVGDNEKSNLPHYKTLTAFNNNNSRHLMAMKDYYLTVAVNLLNPKECAYIYFKDDTKEFEKNIEGIVYTCVNWIDDGGNAAYGGEMQKIIPIKNKN